MVVAEAEGGFESGGNCKRERAGVAGMGDGEGDEVQAGDLELRRLVTPVTRSLSSSLAKGTMSKFLPMCLYTLVANL